VQALVLVVPFHLSYHRDFPTILDPFGSAETGGEVNGRHSALQNNQVYRRPVLLIYTINKGTSMAA
jgi:hypothetical protein